MRQDKERPKFDLPAKLEKILASLSEYYKQTSKPLYRELLVNSRPQVAEGTEFDGWDGGIWSHTVHLLVPQPIYYRIFDALNEVQRELSQDINRFANCPGEYVSEVLLDIQDDSTLQNWRENSGLLHRNNPITVIKFESDLRRLWEPEFFRVFLSHKAQYKKETAQLKEAFLFYGISCFVAHEDIEPTKEWQDEIEKALFSMEAMIPLMTPDFSESKWTDQEIGVAIGRGVPVIPVRMGTDPYGFIGKYQAVNGCGKSEGVLAGELFNLLFEMAGLKERVAEALIIRFERARSFDQANKLIRHLSRLQTIAPNLIERLEKARENNSQIRGATTVNQVLPGLLVRLKKGPVNDHV